MGTNDQNLVPITTKEQARKIGSLGGKVKSLAKRMIHRKFCTITCPMWNTCWAKHTSHILHEKVIEQAVKDKLSEKEIKKLKPECGLKKLPTQYIQRATRFLVAGEQGFKDEIMETLNRLGDKLMLEPSSRSLERYLVVLDRLHRTLFGEKSKIEGLPDYNLITADDFAAAYEISKKKRAEDEQKRKEINRDKPDSSVKEDQS